MRPCEENRERRKGRGDGRKKRRRKRKERKLQQAHMSSYSALARKINAGPFEQMVTHRPELAHRSALFGHTIFLNVFF